MQSFIPPAPVMQAFFIQNGQELHYDKKQMFVRADDPQPWVYFLVEGIVEVTFLFNTGSPRILGYLVPNAVFAQNRQFFENDGDLTYTTIEKTTVYRIHRDSFLSQLDKDPLFTREYLQNTLLFRIFTTDIVIYLGENKIRNRCIRWLMLMEKYYGIDTAEGRCIDIPLTHETAANFLHVSRESVSKILRDLSRQGLIGTHKKRITVKDLAALTRQLEY